MLLGSFVEEYDDLDENLEKDDEPIPFNLDSKVTPQQSIKGAPTTTYMSAHNLTITIPSTAVESNRAPWHFSPPPQLQESPVYDFTGSRT